MAMAQTEKDWRALCKSRKQKQFDSIPKELLIDLPLGSRKNVQSVPYECGLLSTTEIEITDTTDVRVLLEKIRTRHWSSVDVTTAFYKRAIIAHQLTNCLTEIFFDEALERSKLLDNHLLTTGQPIGPLHGLPISLKDQFNVKGIETIMGYASWIGNVAQHNSVLVQILEDLGAIFYVKTNVPQTLSWGETYNNVFGRTTNPYNRYFTSGGSSGGEGALLAMRGSPLGVGTDIGGSLRIPSAFCFLYTLRPSFSRLPYALTANSLLGQDSISSVLGPMATSLSALRIFTKAVIDAEPWRKDPEAIRKEWSVKEEKLGHHGGEGAKLCFAMMWDNGVVRPHPPIWRAGQMVKQSLEAKGHKVVDWQPRDMLPINANAEAVFSADFGYDFHLACLPSGEPVLQTLAPETDRHEFAHDEPMMRGLGLIDEKLAVGEKGVREGGISTWELWQLHTEKRNFRRSQLDQWEATAQITSTGRPVDAIISPAAPYASVPHGLNLDFSYTTYCNAMDYACTVFPVTFADKELDTHHPPHEFYNAHDEAVYKMYDPALFHGAPVGLQLIGRSLEEEGVLAMTDVVVEALEEYVAREDAQRS